MSTTQAEPMTSQEWLASEVRAQQGRLRISGRELARRTDIHPVNLRRRLTGEVPFTFEELVHVARILSMDVYGLADGIE